MDVRERYLAEAGRTRSNLALVLELIFTNPFITVARLERRAGLTAQGARNVRRDAEAPGWLRDAGVAGRGGRRYWVAGELFDIIDAPWSFD